MIKVLFASFFALGRASLDACRTRLHGQRYRSISARTPDNITIAAQEWGNPKGPELVFIHGLGHSHLSWEKQYKSSLANDFRILTYDLRGHGDSEKPPEAGMYSEGKRWGDDLKAVITAAGFKKPALVAWSLGGVVVLNYLHTYGGKDLSGVVFAGAIVGSRPEFFSSLDLFPPLYSDYLKQRSRGIVDFVRACYGKQPDQNDFELILISNAMVPAVMQRAVPTMVAGVSEHSLKSLKRPVLIVHGEKDSLVTKSMAVYAHRLLQNSKLQMYSECGHAPFYEEPARFNEDLRSFIMGIGSHD
jgi:non-heme chloroperoxidase